MPWSTVVARSSLHAWRGGDGWGDGRGLSSDTIFAPIFGPFSTQLHHFPYHISSFMSIFLMFFFPFSFYALSTLTNRRQEHDSSVSLVTDNLIYWAADILKQSCSPSLTWSYTGTLSAALICSHSSKFWTSWTQSMSRSASITQSPLLIVRATLPPSMLFADRVLLCRGYSISEPKAWGETVSKPLGLTLGLVYNPIGSNSPDKVYTQLQSGSDTDRDVSLNERSKWWKGDSGAEVQSE